MQGLGGAMKLGCGHLRRPTRLGRPKEAIQRFVQQLVEGGLLSNRAVSVFLGLTENEKNVPVRVEIMIFDHGG